MADKKTELTQQQQKILLASKGYFPALHEVLYDLPHTMIIRNVETKEPAVIFKD